MDFEILKSGDLEKLQDLINANPDLLNIQNEYGDSLLTFAAWYRQSEIAEYLLEKGIDPYHRNKDGRTAMHNAFETGADDIHDLLVSKGVELDICIASGRGEIEIIRNLLKDEPDLINDVSTGITPLDWAAYGNADGSIDVLIEHGIDVNNNIKTRGFTSLMAAASTCSLNAGRTLLIYGADPNLCDEEGCTPLHYTAQMAFSIDSSEFVRLLFKNGADANIRNDSGLRPIDLLRKTQESEDFCHPSSPRQNRKYWENVIAVFEEFEST